MSAAPTELPLVATAPAETAPTGLRLLPAPGSEPPYDDERPGGRPLPLRPASLRSTPLRLVPALDPDEEVAPRTPAALLPEAKPFAHALVQRLLETLAGLRPVAQLQRHTSLEVYDALEGMVVAGGRPTGPRPDGRAVRSLHVQQRPEGIAEVCATVRRGDRYAAIALRLEGVNGDWRCTELAIP